jgi:anti-sigma factor RsiW
MGRVDEMKCRELVEQVTNYLEGALGSTDSDRLDGHLHSCIACRSYLGEMRVTMQVVSSLPAEPLSEEFEDSLLQMYRDWAGSVSR